MPLSIIRQDSLCKFIEASACLKKELISERVDMMEKTISYGDTEKEIEKYHIALDDILKLTNIINNLDYYADIFYKDIEKSILLNDYIYDIDKNKIVLNTMDELEIGLYGFENELLAVISLSQNWLLNLFNQKKLKCYVSLFKFEYNRKKDTEYHNSYVITYNNKLQNNKGLKHLNILLDKLSAFERYFNIFAQYNFNTILLSSNLKIDEKTTFILMYANNKEELSFLDIENLSFTEVIYNFYNWRETFDIENIQQLRYFLGNISKVKKYFNKKTKSTSCNIVFDFSTYFDLNFISIIYENNYQKGEDIILTINKIFCLTKIMDSIIFIPVDQKSRYEETVFTYKDYLCNKEEVINYINLIDY